MGLRDLEDEDPVSFLNGAPWPKFTKEQRAEMETPTWHLLLKFVIGISLVVIWVYLN